MIRNIFTGVLWPHELLIIYDIFEKELYDHVNWKLLAICVRQEDKLNWYFNPIWSLLTGKEYSQIA